MQRALWLDGLRGIAAAIVTLRHAFVYEEPSPVFDFMFRSYWADPPEENRYFIQLPPFRLLFDGSAMVALFMVISGFAISISILKARNSDITGSGQFVRRISSASTRRIFRIYLPVICVAVISHILFFCNLYRSWPSWKRHMWNLQPLTAPWLHIKFLFWHLLHLMDVVNHRLDINMFNHRPDLQILNDQFWTMPIEFRGSCIVYLLLLTTVFWRPSPRRSTLAVVAAYWFWIGQWDIFSFVAGLWISEGHVVSEKLEADGEISLPCEEDEPSLSPTTTAWKRIDETWIRVSRSESFHHTRAIFTFLVGIFFLSMCDNEPLGMEYQFLRTFFHSPNWKEKEMERRCWTCLGAVLVVHSIGQSEYLQWPLNARPIQYLAKISFPLYLIHMTIYLTLQTPLQNLFWYITRHEWYPGTIEASRHLLPFTVTWVGSLLVLAVIMLVLSDLWERFVDRKCLEIGKKFERWVTG